MTALAPPDAAPSPAVDLAPCGYVAGLLNDSDALDAELVDLLGGDAAAIRATAAQPPHDPREDGRVEMRQLLERLQETGRTSPQDLVPALADSRSSACAPIRTSRAALSRSLRITGGRATRVDRVVLAYRLARQAVVDRWRQLVEKHRALVALELVVLLARTLRVNAAKGVSGFLVVMVLGPGIALREGARVVLSRLLGTERVGRGFFDSAGWEHELRRGVGPLRAATLAVLPPVLTLATGVALLGPLLAAREAVGASSVGVLDNPADFEVSDTGLAAQLFTAGPIVWFGVSCLFAALPSLSYVRESWRVMGRVRVGALLRLVLVPVLAVSACVKPLEWMASRAGVSGQLANGLAGYFLGILLCRGAAALLVAG